MRPELVGKVTFFLRYHAGWIRDGSRYRLAEPPSDCRRYTAANPYVK